jgi:hypothetical protein
MLAHQGTVFEISYIALGFPDLETSPPATEADATIPWLFHYDYHGPRTLSTSAEPARTVGELIGFLQQQALLRQPEPTTMRKYHRPDTGTVWTLRSLRHRTSYGPRTSDHLLSVVRNPTPALAPDHPPQSKIWNTSLRRLNRHHWDILSASERCGRRSWIERHDCQESGAI